MRSRAVAAAFAAMLAGSVPAAELAELQIAKAVGGPGGRPFTAHCEGGKLLVGVVLRAGREIDAVAPVCARALAEATIDRSSQTRHPQMFGGPGGDERLLVCPPERPIVKSLYVEAVRRPTIPDGVRVDCTVARPDAGRSGRAGPSYSGLAPGEGPEIRSSGAGLVDGVLQDWSRCPAGFVGTGIHGASGQFVDRLGLICGPPVTHHPSAKEQLTPQGLSRPPAAAPAPRPSSRPADLARPRSGGR